MPVKSFRSDPALRARRDAMRAYWTAHPATPASEVAARFGVSESTANDAKPYALRSIRPPSRNPGGRQVEADALALKMLDEDATLTEIAEATGRSVVTTRRFLRAALRRRMAQPVQ